MDMAGFRKVLSFWDVFWLGIGGMVGVAILTFPSETFALAGPSSIISWVLAGVFSILMAVVYAEMTTAFPKSGALVVFPYVAFGKGRLARYLAFLEGIGFYIGTLFGIVVSAIILGNYISPWFSSGIGLIVAAEASLLLVGIVNIFGARVTSEANKMMSIIFTALFGIIIALGIWYGKLSNLVPFISGSSGALGIVYSIPIAILAYGSWIAIMAMPEEIKHVKDMPKALLYSIGGATLVYALLVLVTYLNLTAPQLTSQSAYYYPVLALVAAFHSPAMLLLFRIAAILSIVAVMLVMVMGNARITYAMSRLDFLPKSMVELSSHSIPFYATVAAFLIPMALSVFPSYYYQYVVIGAIIGTGVPRVIDLAAYLKIRKRSDYKPTFRVRYGFAIALVALVGLAISEIGISASDTLWSVVTFIVITGAFLLVELRRKKG
jgi:APA family basic amino acid/polyamine antiporter